MQATRLNNSESKTCFGLQHKTQLNQPNPISFVARMQLAKYWIFVTPIPRIPLRFMQATRLNNLESKTCFGLQNKMQLNPLSFVARMQLAEYGIFVTPIPRIPLRFMQTTRLNNSESKTCFGLRHKSQLNQPNPISHQASGVDIAGSHACQLHYGINQTAVLEYISIANGIESHGVTRFDVVLQITEHIIQIA